MQGVDHASKRPIKWLLKIFTNMTNKLTKQSIKKGSNIRQGILESQGDSVAEWLSGVEGEERSKNYFFS